MSEKRQLNGTIEKAYWIASRCDSCQKMFDQGYSIEIAGIWTLSACSGCADAIFEKCEPSEEEQGDDPVIPRKYVGTFDATFVDGGRKTFVSALDEIDMPEHVVSELEVDIVDGGSTEFIADPLNQTQFQQIVNQAINGSLEG